MTIPKYMKIKRTYRNLTEFRKSYLKFKLIIINDRNFDANILGNELSLSLKDQN